MIMINKNYFHNKNSTNTNYKILSVTEISESIKNIVEENFSFVKIQGEISRPSFPTSGHIYFNLKDHSHVISGIIWRNNASKIPIKLEEGLEVICTGKITTYANQSKYQVIIDNVELSGQGVLLKMLEERKKKLSKEGIFDDKYKKKIPHYPKAIGLITSPTGAVIKDILTRLSERFPTKIYLWPVPVQGQEASVKISNAIEGFNTLNINDSIYKPDVLIIARGGGSIEDLWTFNDEQLIRTVFKSEIPIISAIGHETDITLIDFVSDFRSSTPSAAPEIIVPLVKDLEIKLIEFKNKLDNQVRQKVTFFIDKVLTLKRLLGKPDDLIVSKKHNLSFKFKELNNLFINNLRNKNNKLSILTKAIKIPDYYIKNLNHKKQLQFTKLKTNFEKNIRKKEFLLQSASKILTSVSHESILNRGFTLILDQNDKLIKKSCDSEQNTPIKIMFADKLRKGKLYRLK